MSKLAKKIGSTGVDITIPARPGPVSKCFPLYGAGDLEDWAAMESYRHDKTWREVQEFIDGLKVGDKVITTGGIHGQITRLGDISVQLQIADKVRVEVARAAIGGYVGQEPVVEPLSGAAEQTK